jgi:ABC-type nitrate/sulfonate/bicarbonate transport system permease component
MRAGRALAAAALGVVAFVVLWEGYKLVGSPDGTVVFGVRVLPRADDLSMPHLYDIVGRLARPELTGGRPIWIVVLQAAAFTLGITAVGFAVGTLVGLLLAVAMQRFRIVERGLLPYVILSQTVPLVALGPAGGRMERQPDVRAVSVAGLDDRRGDRRVPGVLPGRGRHAARPAVPAGGRGWS